MENENAEKYIKNGKENALKTFRPILFYVKKLRD